MTRKVKLLLALFAVLLVFEGFGAARLQAQYLPFWQRGPVRRTVAFVFSPWVMAYRNYYGYGGYGPGYCGCPVVYDGCVLAQSSTGSLQSDVGALVLDVPESAKVYINGGETMQTGTTRKYFSRGLTLDQRYQYDIRVVGERAGRQVEESKTVFLSGGHRSELAFDLPARQSQTQFVSVRKAEPVETLLKLHVPADATVILVGTETTMKGEDRSYLSTELPEGEHWEGYTIRVEATRDGQPVVAERTITLTGGETREVRLDFKPVAELR